MTATSADVALYTNDGIVISSDTTTGAAIKALHPNARTTGDTVIEMFYDTAANAQIMLDEKFLYVSQANPPHVGIEIYEDISFGEDIPIAPSTPCFTLLDEDGGLSVLARTRAYAHDTGTDRFSLEMLK